MKKLLLTLSVVTASALTMYGQGRVSFNNLASTIGIRVSTTLPNQGASGGAAGATLGAGYSAQLLWAPVGTYTETTFLAAVLGSSAATPFIGTTGGGGPLVDGSGLFDGGTIPNPVGTSMPAGNYTMMARAWYSTGFATYDLAKTGQRNVGFVIFNQSATAFPAGAPTTVFPDFTVAATIPEPSTFALAGLGAAALLLFRRRK
jgi:hypothetical protein